MTQSLTATAIPAADSERTLQVSWADPVETLQRALAMKRDDLLAAMRGGGLPKPPIFEVLGFDVIEVEPGRAVLGFRPSERHYHTLAIVAAGITTTILDAAMWTAVQTAAEDAMATTVNLNVHCIRPLSGGSGDVRAEAAALHVGRRTATAEARLVDAGGKLYAYATSSLLCTPVGAGG